jgi:hypothetical protein
MIIESETDVEEEDLSKIKKRFGDSVAVISG